MNGNTHQLDNIIFQRYRITKLLGEGGAGKTYQAEDISTSQKVAIKIVSLRQAKDWKILELFEREAKTLASLEHPNIPRYIDYFHLDTDDDRCFYLVRELVTGHSLFDLVQQGWQATEDEVKQIAIQVLEILKYLHQQTPPIIHRDIKPQNLIKDDEGKLFLVDFGSVQEAYRQTLSGNSTFVGTFGYMPPEQLRGQVSFASDLYSLGATLTFLLTKKSLDQLPQKRMKIDFCSQAKISNQLANWLERILEPVAEDRFQSADEALVTLQAVSMKYLLNNSRIHIEKNDLNLTIEIPHSGLQGKMIKGGTIRLIPIVFCLHCLNYILSFPIINDLSTILFTGIYRLVFSLCELSFILLVLYSCFGFTRIIFDTQTFIIQKSLWGLGREVTGEVKDIQKLEIKSIEIFNNQNKFNLFLGDKGGFYAIYLLTTNSKNSFGAMISLNHLKEINSVLINYLDSVRR